MTLDPKDDLVMQVIKSYEGYRDTLNGEKRKRFNEMMSLCYQFAEAINAKGEPFTEEAAIMSILLKQHILIQYLQDEIAKLKGDKKQNDSMAF
jgi:hypothetical protein